MSITAFPECNESSISGREAELYFVNNNYDAAAEIASKYGVPTDWVLGWGSFESGWGTNGASLRNGNYFSEGKGPAFSAGAIQCGAGTIARWACFTGFEASADAAFASFYGTIIKNTLTQNPNATAATVFEAVAQAGYDTEDGPGYGKKVSGRIALVDQRIDCLRKAGYID